MTPLRQRDEPIRSTKVLNSAKGQTCTARLPGICNGDPETVVFAHLNGAAFGKGKGRKAHDICGFYSCHACHSYVDVGHGTRAILSDDELLRCILEAVCETWIRLIRAGIIFVPQDIAKPLASRKTQPRLPPEQRRSVAPSRPMAGTKASGIKRKFDGTTERRT